jgi:hypothetical protein
MVREIMPALASRQLGEQVRQGYVRSEPLAFQGLSLHRFRVPKISPTLSIPGWLDRRVVRAGHRRVDPAAAPGS